MKERRLNFTSGDKQWHVKKFFSLLTILKIAFGFFISKKVKKEQKNLLKLFFL